MSKTYRLQKPVVIAPASGRIGGMPSVERPPGRLVSLDAFRGFIMIMLAAKGFGIAKFANLGQDNAVWQTWDYSVFQKLRFHFTHPAWESITGWMGVSFWDMIQPSFMFMVGVAMPFSYAKRAAFGRSTFRSTLHALYRAVVLVLMGVFLYSTGSSQTNWIFPNVLAQIGLGYFFAYLVLGRSLPLQIGIIAAILVGYWGFFVLNPPPENFDYSAVNASVEKGEIYEGRFAPWSKNSNAAHLFDQWFLNYLRMPERDTVHEFKEESDTAKASTQAPAADDEPPAVEDVAALDVGCIRKWWFSASEPFVFNGGGYVTLNFIPSIATTLLGMLCGQLLLKNVLIRKKLVTLIVAGTFCLALGLLAHNTVCPIVKRIWTPSWVLFSGGYAIWMLTGFYFVFDVLPLRRLAFPLVVVGANSIAMYLMGSLLHDWVADHVIRIHLSNMLESLFGSEALNSDGLGAMLVPTTVFAVFWITAYWMYRNRYFVRV